MIFRDRSDAGRKLAAALTDYRDQDAVIYGLPRGGVAVAAEVAEALHAPLDVLLVRKIGVPTQPELAMGAVVDGTPPIIVRNEDVIALARVSQSEFDAVCRREFAEIGRRRKLYGAGRIPLDPKGKIAIVVDDGIATGATMRAALRAMRRRAPKELVLAVPVAPPDTATTLRPEVDTLVCLDMPEDFGALGYFYTDFHQLTDDDVIAILARCANGGGATAG